MKTTRVIPVQQFEGYSVQTILIDDSTVQRFFCTAWNKDTKGHLVGCSPTFSAKEALAGGEDFIIAKFMEAIENEKLHNG